MSKDVEKPYPLWAQDISAQHLPSNLVLERYYWHHAVLSDPPCLDRTSAMCVRGCQSYSESSDIDAEYAEGDRGRRCQRKGIVREVHVLLFRWHWYLEEGYCRW